MTELLLRLLASNTLTILTGSEGVGLKVIGGGKTTGQATGCFHLWITEEEEHI